MTTLTKAAFAREIGVTKTTVSGYVRSGMPCLSNGLIDHEVALAWVDQNIDRTIGRPRSGDVDGGDLAPGGALGWRERVRNPFDRGLAVAATEIVRDLPAIVTAAALRLGFRDSEQLGLAVARSLIDHVTKLAGSCGIEPFSSEPRLAIWPLEPAPAPASTRKGT
jgi:hypothetical protein